MRIGIFGGSFNPVHNGHVYLASCMTDFASLDRLIIIPAGVSPFKNGNGGIQDADRLNMCRLAFCDNRYVVSDIEIKRGGKSYTVDTVGYLRREYPSDELFLFMGSDMLLSFDKWKDWNRILDNVTVCAISRDSGVDSAILAEYADKVLNRRGKIRICGVKPLEISSTEVRRTVASGGDISAFVPAKVKEYIENRGLYREK